jgi:hypothetical protein
MEIIDYGHADGIISSAGPLYAYYIFRLSARIAFPRELHLEGALAASAMVPHGCNRRHPITDCPTIKRQ